VSPLLALVPLVTPTPVPEPAPASGPGFLGFAVTFALVVACIPLFRSMVRKIRGVQYRDPGAEAAAGDDAAARGAAADDAAADGAAARDGVPGAAPDGAADGPGTARP
jgi:hypothetical protein